MELEKVEALIRLSQEYKLEEIEVKEGDSAIRIKHSANQPLQVQAPIPQAYVAPPQINNVVTEQKSSEPQKEESFIEIRSPFVGVFYSAPSPDSEAFVSLNKKVRKGDALCIVEAMKLMNEIEAEREGTIVKILVENEQPVEYNQLLFLMK